MKPNFNIVLNSTISSSANIGKNAIFYAVIINKCRKIYI